MDAVTTLTAGLVDYAGLFPPAGLGMREALENYAGYFSGEDSAILGKFIVPAERLDEMEQAAEGLLPRDSAGTRWPLSVLTGADVAGSVARIAAFNAAHAGSTLLRAEVRAVEVRPASPAAIIGLRAQFPASVEIYVELPLDPELDRSVARVAKEGVRAKIRTGGVEESAFPSTGRVVRFLRACCDAGVPFKATAGLHHPMRARYRLTYEPDSATATMFGYLNLFIAACFMWNGADDATVARILDETDPLSFRLRPDGVSWLDRTLSANRIAEARRAFATSFGSCSFREPVDELENLLTGAASS